MKSGIHEITCDPHFLNGSARFNIEARTKEMNGKVLDIDFSCAFPKPIPIPEPTPEPEPEPINISLKDLLRFCCKYFGVRQKDVKGNYRGGNTIKARLIFLAIARIECGYKLRPTAEAVNKDHASVTNACRSVFRTEKYPDEKVTLAQHYKTIVEMLRAKTI